MNSKVIASEEAQFKATLREYNAAMGRLLKQIKKDQAEIDKLKRETRAILNALKAA